MTSELSKLPVTNRRSTISLASAWNTWQNNQPSRQNTNKEIILIYIQDKFSPTHITNTREYTDIHCQISRVLNILCITHPTKPEPTSLCLSSSFFLPSWCFCYICNLVLSHCPLFLINFALCLWRNSTFKFKYVPYNERKLGVTTTGEQNLLSSMQTADSPTAYVCKNATSASGQTVHSVYMYMCLLLHQ